MYGTSAVLLMVPSYILLECMCDEDRIKCEMNKYSEKKDIKQFIVRNSDNINAGCYVCVMYIQYMNSNYVSSDRYYLIYGSLSKQIGDFLIIYLEDKC